MRILATGSGKSVERVTGVSVLWTVAKDCAGGVERRSERFPEHGEWEICGAGDGNRTRAGCLGSSSSTIELHPRIAMPEHRTASSIVENEHG